MIDHNSATMEQNFDRNRLKVLVWNAMVEFIDFLGSLPHQDEHIEVFSPQHDGNQYQELIRPNLFDAIIGHQDERVKLPAAGALLNYLRQFGHEKMKVSCKNHTGSDKNTYHQLVALPLYKWWSVKSIEALSLDNVWIPWKLSDVELDQVIAGVLRIEQEDATSRIVVIAPLIGVALDNVDKIELADGVELRAWTQAEKAVYLHKNDRHLNSLDIFSLLESKCYLQVTALNSQVFTDKKINNINALDKSQLEEFVGFNMSRAKWALMQAINPGHLIEELLVVTETDDIYSHSWFFPFRRQSKMPFYSSPSCIVTEALGFKAAKLLKELEVAIVKFPDLDDVLWRFDRATIASTPRDILFESTVGLESLLVNGSGENSRRFKTYGAALVGGGNSEEISRNLNEIYNLRSDNAHSSKRKLKNVDELSIVAQSYFVSVIASVVHLVVTAKITPLVKDGKRDNKERCINRSIERYLTSLMYEAAHKALQEPIN